MAASPKILTNHYRADEEDDVDDEDDFDDENDVDDADDEGDDDEDEEEETWQVGRETDSAKRPLWLDFGY